MSLKIIYFIADVFGVHNIKIDPPHKGMLLLAEPFMSDPNFERSVLVLCDSDPESGSFGYVLNKPSSLKLGDVVEGFSDIDFDLYIGGPVEQNTLHFVHNVPNELENAMPLGDNLYFGGNFDKLMELIEDEKIGRENVRFLLGYSGWGQGQLEEELKKESWITLAHYNPSELISAEPDMMWRNLLLQRGGQYKILANFPQDPRLN